MVNQQKGVKRSSPEPSGQWVVPVFDVEDEGSQKKLVPADELPKVVHIHAFQIHASILNVEDAQLPECADLALPEDETQVATDGEVAAARSSMRRMFLDDAWQLAVQKCSERHRSKIPRIKRMWPYCFTIDDVDHERVTDKVDCPDESLPILGAL